MKPTKKNAPEEIEILRVSRERVEFCIVGNTPLILHRLSEKAKRELLLPKKKSAAERAGSLKHNPFAEFRDSAIQLADAKAPTLLALPAPAFKCAMMGACLDIPNGAAKAQIGRLAFVMGYRVPIYGNPFLFMTPVRSSDMKRTPDIRTRCIVWPWACRITVEYVVPILKQQPVCNLLAAGGIMQGVGDGRVEKGKLDFGQYEIVEKDDKRFLEATKFSRKFQIQAMEAAVPYDDETKELLEWFSKESSARGFKQAGAAPKAAEVS